MLAVATNAVAGEAYGPVCADPEVLQLVADRLGRASQPVWLEAASVGQVSAGPSRVYCAVRAHKIVYDTRRYGPSPVDLVSDHRYALYLGRNGVFVQMGE